LRKLLVDRRLKRVDITCSIDCWGEQQEFVRYGLKLENWQKNFELLLKNPWLHIHTGHTVTSLSINTFPDLLQRIAGYQSAGHRIHQTFQHVDGVNQSLYDPIFFGGDFFRKDLQAAEALIPAGAEKDRFIGIMKRTLDSRLDLEKLKNLRVTLDIIDYRRKTDWKSIFPKIYQFLLEQGL